MVFSTIPCVIPPLGIGRVGLMCWNGYLRAFKFDSYLSSNISALPYGAGMTTVSAPHILGNLARVSMLVNPVQWPPKYAPAKSMCPKIGTFIEGSSATALNASKPAVR